MECFDYMTIWNSNNSLLGFSVVCVWNSFNMDPDVMEKLPNASIDGNMKFTLSSQQHG